MNSKRRNVRNDGDVILSRNKLWMCNSSTIIGCLLLSLWLSESSSTIVVNAFSSSSSSSSTTIRRPRVLPQVVVPSLLWKKNPSLPTEKKDVIVVSGEKYGRGAEIFPLTNEKSFTLSDSFPNGIIPPMASELLTQVEEQQQSTTTTTSSTNDMTEDIAIPPSSLEADGTNTEDDDTSSSSIVKAASRGRKRKIIKSAISKILRGAAGAEEEALVVGSSTSTIDDIIATPISKSPIFIALSLMGLGLVHMVDIFTVVLMSAYMIILGILSNSPLSTSNLNINSGDSFRDGFTQAIPALPSLPLQGHVPSLVSNPLGTIMTNSNIYRMWLRAGTILGLVAPIVTTFWYITRTFLVNSSVAAATALTKEQLLCNKLAAIACARPLFLLSCQAVTEAVSRRTLAPLPLRIFIPVAYNTIRLGSLWQWTITPKSLGYAGRILAASNFIYWSINLFAFLIPTATMRYLRAHFFCVEATEVQVREGGDNHVGLIS